jgi:hypothetical protein
VNEYVQSVLDRRGSKALLIDTNVFILFVVGSHSSRAIRSFKRTDRYTEEDFHMLVRIVDLFLPHSRILTTPHVLTEVSNLAGQAAGALRTGIFQALARVIPQMDERNIAANTLVNREAFAGFGITDCGVLELESPESIVLTDDLALARLLELKRRAVLNFNHLRIERMRRR